MTMLAILLVLEQNIETKYCIVQYIVVLLKKTEDHYRYVEI